MTDRELMIAKNNYEKLCAKNKKVASLYDEVSALMNNSEVQEHIILSEYGNMFSSRLLELANNEYVKKYLSLKDKYGYLDEKSDNVLIEEAFDGVLEGNSNIYVFITYYTGNYEWDLIKDISKDTNNPICLLMNLENGNVRMVRENKIGEFKDENVIVNFGNKHGIDNLEFFRRFRIMYLRQFLFDNEEVLSSKKINVLKRKK